MSKTIFHLTINGKDILCEDSFLSQVKKALGELSPHRIHITYKNWKIGPIDGKWCSECQKISNTQEE